MAVDALTKAMLQGMDPGTYRSLSDIEQGNALQQVGMDASPTSKWGAIGRIANAAVGSYISNSATSDLAKAIANGKKSGLDQAVASLEALQAKAAPVLMAPPAQAAPPTTPLQPLVQPRVPDKSSPFPQSQETTLPALAASAPPPGSPAATIANRFPGDPAFVQSAQTQITPPAEQPVQTADAGPVAAINSAMQPRGIRNNNALNIEDGPFAKSQPGYAGSDGRFAKFETPEHGTAAASALLDAYDSKHGLNTVAGIVNRWAPPSDGNNTMAYATDVAGKLGIDPNAPVPKELRPQLIAAMAQHENGKAVPGTVGAPYQIAGPAVAAPRAAAGDDDEAPTAAAAAAPATDWHKFVAGLQNPYLDDTTKQLLLKLALDKLTPKEDEFAATRNGDIFNRRTGDFKKNPNTAPPDQLSGLQGPARLDALKQIDPARASQVQAVLEGRTPYPVGSRLNPQQQQLKEDVTQIDPNYTSGTYQARSNFQKSMAGTAPGTFGGQVRSAGTVAKHLGDADNAISTLESGRLGAGDMIPALNGIKGYIRNQSGDQEYQNAVGHYETARKGLSDEVETLLAGGHGAEGSKNYWLDRLDLNKHGPTEVRGALDEFRSLMNGRISNVAQEKDRVFGDEAGHTDPLTLFGPHEREIMQRIQNHTWGAKQQYGNSPGKAAPAPAAPPAPALAKLIANPTPQMKQHFDDVFGTGAADRALGGK